MPSIWLENTMPSRIISTDADKTVAWKYRTRTGTARIAAAIAAFMDSTKYDCVYHPAFIAITRDPISDEVRNALYDFANDHSTCHCIYRSRQSPSKRLYDQMRIALARMEEEGLCYGKW
jgi:hypothetical protein